MAVDSNAGFTGMVRIFSSTLSLILFAVTFTACAKEGEMFLELKDVQFFQVQQAASVPVTLKLSGLAFHSSLAIRDIATVLNDESLQVLVHLTPATGKLSGNLDYTFTVPASVNTVSFGKEKVVIWSRSAGIVYYK